MPDSAPPAGSCCPPNLAAIVLAGGELSYREFTNACSRAAQCLAESGVVPGAVVGVALGQTPECIVLLRALAHIGAVACMIDPRWPQNEISGAAAAAGCARIIDSFPMDTAGGVKPAPDPDASRPSTIVFTSGSASRPKPAVHSLDNHRFSAIAANRNIPLRPGDRWLLSLPLHHVAGIAVLHRCAAAGAAVAVPGPRTELAEAIEALRPTHLSLVPTQLARLLALENPARAFAGVKAVLLGGAPMPAGLTRRAVELGVQIHTSYGLTETSSQITATAPGEPLEALLTSGRPLSPATVAISDDGEIMARGGALFLGYKQDGGVHRPVTREGWFATGDLGRFDACGRLVVTGRRDNMFVSGGENVQPEEIERRLCDLPGVEHALVVPMHDAEFGEVGAAFVKMADGQPPNPERLKAQLREQLPDYKIPKQFRPWPQAMPENPTKLARRKIGLA